MEADFTRWRHGSKGLLILGLMAVGTVITLMLLHRKGYFSNLQFERKQIADS